MKCIYCQQETANVHTMSITNSKGEILEKDYCFAVVCSSCHAKSPDCKDKAQCIDMYLHIEKRLKPNSRANMDSEAIMFYRNKANKLVNLLNEVKKDFEEYKIITDGLVAQYKKERNESREYCETLKESIMQIKESEVF